MEAPDKIYIEQKAVMYDLVNTEPCKPDDYEYLRKGALLEWAKNLKERWEEPPMSRHSPGCVYMLEQVIKKIESL